MRTLAHWLDIIEPPLSAAALKAGEHASRRAMPTMAPALQSGIALLSCGLMLLVGTPKSPVRFSGFSITGSSVIGSTEPFAQLLEFGLIRYIDGAVFATAHRSAASGPVL